MDNTPFAGLERLDIGDPIGPGFLYANPTIIDFLLKVGAITHRHDAHARLGDPITAPSVTPSNAGGSIPSDTPVYVGYTFIDADGGETLLSDATQVSTDPGLPDPTIAPDAVVDNTAGTLLADTYYYAVTVTDGLGGETMLGPSTEVVVDPGFPNARVTISGLDDIMADVGGTGWRLWRAVGAGIWHMLATGVTAAVVDDGSFHGDCDVVPPTTPQTNKTNKLTVQVAGPAPTGAVSFNLYLSLDGSFESPSLVANHLVADLGTDIEITDLLTTTGAPPAVSLTLPGAAKIDPDADMVDFPWKRPVADLAALPAVGNTNGDIRETLDDHTLHTWNGAAWVALAGGGGGATTVALDTHVPIWQKAGVDVLWLYAHEITSEDRVVFEEFDGAAGTIGDGYARNGTSAAIPEAGSNNTNAIHYGAFTPSWAQLWDGYVERTFTIGSLNFTRIGVTLGDSRIGLFAWITVAGDLVIATRTVDSNLEADFTVIATDALPAAPAIADTYNIRFDRVANHLHATVFQSKSVVAEVEVDIPVPLRAAFGDGVNLQAGLADRWSNPDAWTTDFLYAVWHHHRRQLWAESLDDAGTTNVTLLHNGDGETWTNFGSQDQGGYEAGWADLSGAEATIALKPDGWVELFGRSVKSSGAAPVAGDIIATLDPRAAPLMEVLAPVATGDDSGQTVGMVRINAGGQVIWVAGTSSAPGANHPFVSYDGISYRGNN